MRYKLTLICGGLALSTLLLSPSLYALDISAQLYRPAGQCLMSAGRTLSNMGEHLSTEAAANNSVTYAQQNLAGPLANVRVDIDTVGPDDIWHIVGAMRVKGCGILSDAAVSCYLVDPCENAIGPNTSYTCNSDWWNGLDSELYQVSCHLTIKPSNVGLFSNHTRICNYLTSYMAQGKSFFDIVSADGASECNLF